MWYCKLRAFGDQSSPPTRTPNTICGPPEWDNLNNASETRVHLGMLPPVIYEFRPSSGPA